MRARKRLTLLALAWPLTVTAAGSAPALDAQGAPPITPDLFSGLTWRCVGPFDGGPVASVQGIAGEPGVYVITTPSGGTWKTTDGGENWTPIDGTLPAPASADPHRWVDPANPRRIARTAANGIEVSLDGDASWTAFHRLPIAEGPPASFYENRKTTPGVFDPVRPSLIFAGTATAVHVSFDAGVHWSSLQLNMPAVEITDLDIRGANLVAATRGRSTWILDDISPLRQVSAASASARAILFAPGDAVLMGDGAGQSAVTYLDYYLGPTAKGEVILEVIDATGRPVHRASSVAGDARDRWLPVARQLATSPGHHRVAWNLRFDPPPSPHHRFAQLARALFENTPAEPDGPVILAGTYQVRLTVGGQVYSRALVVRNDPRASPAELEARRQQFDLAMRTYAAMETAHRGFLQLTRLRPAVASLLTHSDAEIAASANDLDLRLNAIDGSEWTGLVVPDVDNDTGEIEEDEGEVKHPESVPPQGVPLSKDYDDPTSILGRRFENVQHAPAFAILAASLGGLETRVGRDTAAPDALALDTYAKACQQLRDVLDQWRDINTLDLPRLNRELTRRRLSPLPIAATIPAVSCGPAR